MSADRYTHTHQLMSYELVYTSIHSSIIGLYILTSTIHSTVLCFNSTGRGDYYFVHDGDDGDCENACLQSRYKRQLILECSLWGHQL